ncbi:MAG: DUF4249 family protein [Flavobacteriaceae bacterium]
MGRIFILITSLFILVSCQDVVDVDLPTDASRLVVDALIRIDENQPFTDVTIRLSQTSSYFTEVEALSGADVGLTRENSTDNAVVLEETNPGTYEARISTHFLTSAPLIMGISIADEIYVARATYVPSVPLDDVKQGTGTLFGGEETEIVISFTDEPDRTDYYLFDLDYGEYLVSEDTFYPGQSFGFSYFYDDGLQSGMSLEVAILGVDLPFYNYMGQLILQSTAADQGPFQTPVATVRGNIINATGNEDVNSIDAIVPHENFALGYFALCQEYTDSIIIE